jgi:hypothetical protein
MVPERGLVELVRAVGGSHNDEAVGPGGRQSVELHQELCLQPPRRLVLATRPLTQQRVHLVHEYYRRLQSDTVISLRPKLIINFNKFLPIRHRNFNQNLCLSVPIMYPHCQLGLNIIWRQIEGRYVN